MQLLHLRLYDLIRFFFRLFSFVFPLSSFVLERCCILAKAIRMAFKVTVLVSSLLLLVLLRIFLYRRRPSLVGTFSFLSFFLSRSFLLVLLLILFISFKFFSVITSKVGSPVGISLEYLSDDSHRKAEGR